jgi:hypothetical protein
MHTASQGFINGLVVVEQGQVITVDMGPVVGSHNRFALQFANKP